MANPAECQIVNQVFGQVYCQSFNCSKRAAYSIGRLIGPMSLRMNLCEQCTIDLLVNAPDELWDKADLIRDARASELAAEIEAAKPTFTCSKCGAVFKNALAAQGHEKKCKGGGA